MHSPLTLYYLNHLGIRPWILKTRSDNGPAEVDAGAPLILMVREHLSDNARQLLEQIKIYLQKNYLFMVHFVNQDILIEQLNEISLRYKPFKVILAGLSLGSSIINSPSPLIQVDDLERLVSEPILKKRFWQALS
ncbi:MAG: hypothetical protein BGO90_04480 [Legionella sp. 40-6]|nr:hypothetical protein [Legionella sp.]OJY17314.1 MAG: hypothetical protein BGO90_04480 [Legionella sp. 40-6]